MTNSEKNGVIVRTLSFLDGCLKKFEISVLSIGIMVLTANTIANVFGRYVFSQSIYFSEELNEFLIVIITFVGIGYATREGRHIRMSAIYDTLSARNQKILMIFIAATTAAILFVLAWYAYEYVEKVYRRGRMTPALQFPLYLTYIWVIVGFVIAGIQYVLTAIKNMDLSDPRVFISYTTEDMYEDPDIHDALQKEMQKDEGSDPASPAQKEGE
jgi:TRAP-type C4-dicarboxylate transport system permease small subunit